MICSYIDGFKEGVGCLGEPGSLKQQTGSLLCQPLTRASSRQPPPRIKIINLGLALSGGIRDAELGRVSSVLRKLNSLVHRSPLETSL